MKYSRDQLDTDPRTRLLGELASLYEAARPLPTLSEDELRRMRRRVRRSMMGGQSTKRFYRLTPVVVGLLLLFIGGLGYAAVGRFSWVKQLWVEEKASQKVANDPAQIQNTEVKIRRNVTSPSELPTVLPAMPDPLLLPTNPFKATDVPVKGIEEAKPVLPRQGRARLEHGQIAFRVPLEPTHFKPVEISVADVPETSIPSPLPQPVISQDASAPHQDDIELAVPHSEAALVRRAMQNLRQENNPEGALILLDELTQRFPKGSLIGERAILEVEALLSLKREALALARLDGMNLSDLPRSGERFVVRGELRALHRRYAEAAMDFDRALARVSGIPAWHERALWGRAVARLRNGDRVAGIADLEDYLEQYPRGRYAVEASRLLQQR